MKKFEYKTILIKSSGPWWSSGKIDPDQITVQLNELGQDGWELISAFDTNIAYGQTGAVFLILKRELNLH